MNGVAHVEQRFASLMLTVLGLSLAGCNTTNTAMDATTFYARGLSQKALDVLSEAKSSEKNQHWATLQEATVALDANRFDRAAAAVSWVEARDEVIDERAVLSGAEIGEDLGSALIDERLREWVPSLGERVMYEYVALMIDLLRGNADQARVSCIRIAQTQSMLEEDRGVPTPTIAQGQRQRAEDIVDNIDREPAYQRAVAVYEGAAEDSRCAVASLLAGWTRLQLGDSAGRVLLQEAAALAPEHEVPSRLLGMSQEACAQTVLVIQEDGLCPTLRPLRFNVHTWETGVARVALPIPQLRTGQTVGPIASRSGEPFQTLTNVDELYLAEEFERAPARLIRTATRLLSQELATRGALRQVRDEDTVSRSLTRLSASLLRTVLVDADVRSWDTRPSVIRVGLVEKSSEGTIELELPEGVRKVSLPPGPNFVRIRTRSGIPTEVQTSPSGLFGARTEPMNQDQKGNDL